ncbi:hypothetical protein D9757_012407 [Collybiopsis confluens]|uniref:Ku70/Ku80 C-terminal arm domain-containing protein n=1 Tax=Collybiopsis confluens TaxID=2823264 RepID=A0A8H5LYZ4_9AGAR|nr:hypothetical protein D9757_012407 [Collybiopsis confluens]
MPFADDIRSAPVEEGFIASDELKDAARQWINGPDLYPNPALAYHYEQLEASAFQEPYNADEFEDLTEPNVDMIHKKAGALLVQWKLDLLDNHAG